MTENENLTNESATTTEVDGAQYIQALNELKQNSVSREEYMKLKAENKQLLDTLVSGGTIEQPTQKEPEISDEELREQLFHRELNNLDYCKNALELRTRVIAEGGKDPFLPQGHDYVVQQSDIETANRVASVMQECIDYADGNSDVFTQELMRRTNDTGRIPRNRR